MSARGNIVILSGALLLAAGCSSYDRAVDRTAPGLEDSSTAPAPDISWTPPATVQAAVDAGAPPEPEPVPAGPLSLAQLAGIALRNNPATHAAWMNARAAEAALGSQKSVLYPELDFNAELARQKPPVSGGRTAFEQTTWGPSLGLTWLLFDFGGRSSAIDQARQALVAADYLHNAAIQDVVLRVEQAYYLLLGARALLDAQESTMRELTTNLEAAEARHAAGVATIADVLQAKTALARAQLNRDSYEGAVEVAKGVLATQLGYRASTVIEVGELPADVHSDRIEGAVEELIGRAEQQRPDLAAARAEAKRARRGIDAARSQGLPSLSLAADANRTYYDAPDNQPSFNSWSAAILFRVPVFNGFRTIWNVREAEAGASNADAQARSLSNQVDLQVWVSFFAARTAGQRVRTSRDLLASALESQEVARGRYKEGVGSILDLLTAQSALDGARAEEVRARADWLFAVAQLAHDIGALGGAVELAP